MYKKYTQSIVTLSAVLIIPTMVAAQELDRTILPIPDPVRPPITEVDARKATLGDFKDVMLDSVIASMDTHQSLASQVLKEDNVKVGFAKLLLDMIFSEMNSQT